MSLAPTENQLRVWECIKDFIATHGYPPSRREISLKLGFKSSNSTNTHIKGLIKHGLISHAKGTARSLRVL